MITARPAAASSQRKAGSVSAAYGLLCRGIFKDQREARRGWTRSDEPTVTATEDVSVMQDRTVAKSANAVFSTGPAVDSRYQALPPFTHATVAQRIEQRPSKPLVGGSIPSGCAIHKFHSAFFSLRANRKKVAA